MEERSYRILEFDKVRGMLAEHCASDMGRALALAHVPAPELAEVRKLQRQTLEAETLAAKMGGSPLRSFDDTTEAIARAKLGSALSMRDLLQVGRGLGAARAARQSLVKPEEEGEPGLLTAMASNLTAMRELQEDIERCILSEEEMADNASADLAHIRRQMRLCNERVREKLQGMIRSSAFAKYLQDPIVTMRGDRYVLPVRQEYRGNVPGIVHDQSGSGATLFVEPMAVVEINNQLRELAAKEREEVDRILAALSAQVGSRAEDLTRNLAVLAQLDFIFARAALADRMRAVPPELNDRGVLDIRRGRHPLIPRDRVVPIDLWLGEDFTTLLVTGPNTGGKTVTLKTVGLFTLMAQAGLFVPAEPGTKLAVFSDVFADIGDEQSIEQSLSTFSSHMTNLVRILDRADGGALVLLDELGAGTDPTEGAALAMAILDELHGRRARVMATTHYSELKAFALTREGIENASMEFDVETLRPTYRLSIGVPGRSNAFEISKRLGLNGELIERARSYLSGEDIRFEDVIGRAETHRRVAARERERAEQARKETIKLRNQVDAMKRQMEEQRNKLMRQAREESRRVLLNAKEEAETIIREVRRMQEAGTEAERTRIAQEGRGKLAKTLEGLQEPLVQPKANALAGEPAPTDLKPGERVRVLTVDQPGTVLTRPDRGEVQVQVGIMKMNVKLKDLRREKEEKPQRGKGGGRSTPDLRSREIALSIDLRGLTLDEAELAADQYLDSCVMCGLTEVSLIHGKGTGALRAGLQQYLRKHPHVAGFRIGAYGEGDAGVTVVTLK